jgi:hypothetical protein
VPYLTALAAVNIRLAIRGFAGPQLKFKDVIEIEDSELDSVLPGLAAKHANALQSHELHMIEIEFLDEPDPLQRFFRFGTDPSGMVVPIEINLANKSHARN